MIQLEEGLSEAWCRISQNLGWFNSQHYQKRGVASMLLYGSSFDGAMRRKSQDFLLPYFPRNYIDFMDEISSDSLYEGLLGWGLFTDKLPPMFTSEPFMRYCRSHKVCLKSKGSDWVVFSYIRNAGVKRDFGIPSPFAYEMLVQHISNHWHEIRDILRQNTCGHPYRISRIHIRNRKDSESLFSMNYHCWQIDEDPIPALLVGNRYSVTCDISRCFPSIYTHALDWAILGKEVAKKNTRGKECRWSHDLDRYTMNLTNGETHGLLVGPHVSNLLAELILTRIDKTLFDKGYRFIRHIDDYQCFVDGESQGHSFILDLECELNAFGLSTNQRKTQIKNLPLSASEDWVNALKCSFPNSDPLRKSDTERFLDIAISIANKSGNSSVFSYAFGMLAKRKMSLWARKYYGDTALHMAYALPYLLPFLEHRAIEAAKIPNKHIEVFANLLYRKSIEERDYLSAAYAIYFAIRYKFEIDPLNDKEEINPLLHTGDCILLTCALVYARRQQKISLRNRLIKHAKGLAKNESDFQKYWVFVYEALSFDQMPTYSNGAWRTIKRHGISFIDQGRLDAPLNNNESLEEILEALNEKTSITDQHDAGEAAPQGRNEL